MASDTRKGNSDGDAGPDDIFKSVKNDREAN